MKKYIYIIGTLLIGIGLGYLFFGNQEIKETSTMHEHEKNDTWTCSMHPQIMQSEPGDCPICGMDLIPKENNSEGLSPNQFKMTKNAIALANIQTTVINASGAGEGTLELSGKIMENEDANQVQTAHYNGRVEKLYIKAIGETVYKGQLLAEVYSPELVAAQQELLTAVTLKKAQPRLYTTVRNKLKNWKLSEKQIDEIERKEIKIENLPIHAHISGVVTSIMIEDGGHITKGHPLFKIANLSTVWAELDAYEYMLNTLQVHQEIVLKVNAYPKERIKAKISFIDPILNTDTRIVKVRAVLKNRKMKLKPGMFISGEILNATTIKTELTIPKSAVLWTGKRSVVYIKVEGEEPVFEMREIELGNREGDSYQITKGINIGDEIVTEGTFTVDAAAQLQGKKSMMTSIKTDDMKNKMILSNEAAHSFSTLITPYMNVKDAFVQDNTEKVIETTRFFLNKLNNIKEKELTSMLTFKDLSVIAERILKEQGNLNEQRDEFRMLSKQMIAIVSAIDELEKTLYIQHCPMANQNNGADWLSYNNEIRNPYFGEAMLTCGSVIEEI